MVIPCERPCWHRPILAQPQSIASKITSPQWRAQFKQHGQAMINSMIIEYYNWMIKHIIHVMSLLQCTTRLVSDHLLGGLLATRQQVIAFKLWLLQVPRAFLEVHISRWEMWKEFSKFLCFKTGSTKKCKKHRGQNASYIFRPSILLMPQPVFLLAAGAAVALALAQSASKGSALATQPSETKGERGQQKAQHSTK